MSEAFPNLDALKKLASRDPAAFSLIEAEVLNELESENARLIWWPKELPIPYFEGPVGNRKVVIP